MNLSTALETNTEATEVMQPGMPAFNNQAILAKAAAMFGTALGDRRLDTTIAQRSSMPLGVANQHRRRPHAAFSVDGLAIRESGGLPNRVDQRQQLRDVVDICAGQDRGERRAVGVGDDMVLGIGYRSLPVGTYSLIALGAVSRSTPAYATTTEPNRPSDRPNAGVEPQPWNRVAVRCRDVPEVVAGHRDRGAKAEHCAEALDTGKAACRCARNWCWPLRRR